MTKKERAALPPYTGVPSGPHLKHYEAWLKTPGGQRVEAEKAKRSHFNGYLDFMLDLCNVGVTQEQIDKFLKDQ